MGEELSVHYGSTHGPLTLALPQTSQNSQFSHAFSVWLTHYRVRLTLSRRQPISRFTAPSYFTELPPRCKRQNQYVI